MYECEVRVCRTAIRVPRRTNKQRQRSARAIPATEVTRGSALIKATDHLQTSKIINICQWPGSVASWRRGRKGIFTLKLRKPGWTEQSKVVSECNFNMQTDVGLSCVCKSEIVLHCFTRIV